MFFFGALIIYSTIQDCDKDGDLDLIRFAENNWRGLLMVSQELRHGSRYGLGFEVQGFHTHENNPRRQSVQPALRTTLNHKVP